MDKVGEYLGRVIIPFRCGGRRGYRVKHSTAYIDSVLNVYNLAGAKSTNTTGFKLKVNVDDDVKLLDAGPHRVSSWGRQRAVHGE